MTSAAGVSPEANPDDLRMKISKISVYRVLVPFKPLGSLWVGRRKPSHLDSTVVAVETDGGLVVYGESCPIGAVYLPAFAGGVRAGIAELAPALLGQDACALSAINQTMNDTLYGHPHVKAGLDIACWDVFGKACGLPVSELLGGRVQDKVPAYASIPLAAPDEMAATVQMKQAEGFTLFQIKVGADPVEDAARVASAVGAGRTGDLFMVDANRSWSEADALRAVRALDGIDCYIEQPCASYEECLTVRARCRHPFILDEVIDDARGLARAIADNALDAQVIKVTHAGGLTQARLQKDLCAGHGIKMRIEDTAGTEVVRAAQAQLAATLPGKLLLGSYPFVNDMPAVADGAPSLRDGCLELNDRPGLGLAPRAEALGEPVAVYT